MKPIILIAALTAVALVTFGAPAANAEDNTGIEVTGLGVLRVPATIMVVQVNVGAIGQTAGEASDRVKARAEEVISDFRRFGLKPEDWVMGTSIARRPMPEEPKRLAFWATTSLSSRLEDFGAAPDMFDRATALNAAAIDFRFEIDDPQMEYEKALKRALADAQFKADALAREMGRKVGPLLGCTELSDPPGPAPLSIRFLEAMDAEEERGSDVPAPRRAADLRPHEIETLAMVRARFSLQD
jgi:uncharacterized protein YggE